MHPLDEWCTADFLSWYWTYTSQYESSDDIVMLTWIISRMRSMVVWINLSRHSMPRISYIMLRFVVYWIFQFTWSCSDACVLGALMWSISCVRVFLTYNQNGKQKVSQKWFIAICMYSLESRYGFRGFLLYVIRFVLGVLGLMWDQWQ